MLPTVLIYCLSHPGCSCNYYNYVNYFVLFSSVLSSAISAFVLTVIGHGTVQFP